MAARRSEGRGAQRRSCCCTRSCSRRSSCCSPWSRCARQPPGRRPAPEAGLGGGAGPAPPGGKGRGPGGFPGLRPCLWSRPSSALDPPSSYPRFASQGKPSLPCSLPMAYAGSFLPVLRFPSLRAALNGCARSVEGGGGTQPKRPSVLCRLGACLEGGCGARGVSLFAEGLCLNG